MTGYNSYESGPAQDPYYQNGSFNAGIPEQYGPPDSANGFNQGYGNYEGALKSCRSPELLGRQSRVFYEGPTWRSVSVSCIRSCTSEVISM
jgi:hypothetical protein